MNWHQLSLLEITESLETNPSGIDAETASQRLHQYGKNQIEDTKKKTVFQMILNQFADFMILILIVAAIISGILGDLADTIIILVIVILNATVGFIQDYRAEKAIEALKQIGTSFTHVMRNGKEMEIPSSDLVPGDVVLLKAGNIIPADLRFFETHQLKVDESSLTGESQNAEKNTETLLLGNYSLGDQTNMGFKGSFVTNGRALAYVVSTGMNTQLGRIAQMIQTDETSTQLQKRLASFGKLLSIIILFICTAIFMIGWIRGEAVITILLTSISLAVAAIPEALPALVTISLAFGAKRMAKNKALIRKLPAVETLGSVTYICSDKTGTLTMNQMSVQEIYEISDLNLGEHFQNIDPLISAMALSNDVSTVKDGKLIGDPIEVALVRYANMQNADKSKLEKKYPRVAEIPFDSTRKCMTTLHKSGNKIIAITKGAVDELLKKLAKDQIVLIPEFEKRANLMAKNGYRVLGYAIKILNELPNEPDVKEIESSLTLIGFVCMIDPPREEAKLAITDCKKAGIIPIMITGDHKLTAEAIAKKLGIITTPEQLVLNGSELAEMSKIEFEKIVENVRVYARVNPEQKLDIIRSLQNRGQIVAMTGDGINDAPALKNADIGIAMGINGTEVSKEAAHMILLDDNFATIVVAVKLGRQIFDNILKFIKYILTGNTGEILTIFLAPFFGLPIPLLAIHILWINLVTDGLPGLALASEKPEANIMKRQPRSPKANIFAQGMAIHIIWVGLLMALVTIGIQAWAISNQNSHWQTMAFTVLCLSQMGHAMAIRSERLSIFEIGILSNKPMIVSLLITILLQLIIIYSPFCNTLFKTQALTLFEIIFTILVSSIVFWAVEIEKKLKRHILKTKNAKLSMER